MTSVSKFSYRRLRYDYGGLFDQEAEETAFRKKRNLSRFRKFTVRRRPKLRIPGLRRFLKKRIRFFSKVKVSWKRAIKRLKNGQVHLNDLFGGNYLLMQVNVPTSLSLSCGQRAFVPQSYSPGKIASNQSSSQLVN